MTQPQDADIPILSTQDRLLQLPRLDADFAWALGCALREAALAQGQALAIEVRIAGQTAFWHAMAGTTPGNADWARRKRNTVELLGISSYQVGCQLARDHSSLEARMGLPPRDYASHGGSVPLKVGGQLLGSATVSGLPQRDDHNLAVAVLARLAGVDLGDAVLG